jgi:LDH2 family malate/lactate/ureidoglycolate dehydrogenase
MWARSGVTPSGSPNAATGLVIVAGLRFAAYHGAKVASILTSPIAIGIPGPSPERAPLVLDMATSVTAWGRIGQAAATASQFPEAQRSMPPASTRPIPAKSPPCFPFGGRRAGVFRSCSNLTGVLAGTPIIGALGRDSAAKTPIQNAMVVGFNIAAFRALTDYRRDIEDLVQAVKAILRRDVSMSRCCPVSAAIEKLNCVEGREFHYQSGFGPIFVRSRKSSVSSRSELVKNRFSLNWPAAGT